MTQQFSESPCCNVQQNVQKFERKLINCQTRDRVTSLLDFISEPMSEAHDRPVTPILANDASMDSSTNAAYEYLSLAAQQSQRNIPSSPDSHLNRTPLQRKHSLSPIRRISKKESNTGALSSEHASDAEAALVVIENPDGSLVEGIPSGFKHSTPVPTPPRSPRTFAFAATGLDLVDLFRRHERVFLVLMLLTVFVDSILLTEEVSTVVSGALIMRDHGDFSWSTRLGTILPYLTVENASKVSTADQHIRQTFSVFPPTWPFASGVAVVAIDLVVCLLFFLAGLVAYVSKKRKSYAWFGTVACGALIWQVLLSCVDKLSLVLFLFRLACFTHTRFMGDLMDDIALLASFIGARAHHAAEHASVRAAADTEQTYDSIS